MASSRSKDHELTLGPVVERFFGNYLCHTKGPLIGTPMLFEDWQREDINEMFRVDENGDRLYRQILYGMPRGNGKTPLAAGIGLFELMTRRDAPEIYNIAGAEAQAQDLTDFSTNFVERGLGGEAGKLRRWLTAHKKAVTHKSTLGTMRLLASSGALLHSKSVSVAIADEIHGFEYEDQVESWVALYTALHKRPNSYSLGITTAGFSKMSLLGRMYLQALATMEIEESRIVPGVRMGKDIRDVACKRVGRDLENKILFIWYGPPDDLSVEDAIADPRIWDACNPAEWITSEALRLQLSGLGFDEYDFARLHLNAWTQAKSAFISIGDWRKNRSEAELQRTTVPTCVAVDVGLTHDTSAVSWSQPLDVIVPGEAGNEDKVIRKVVNRCRIWSARPSHENDKTARHVFVPGGRMTLFLVEEFIEALARSYAIKELVYDPTFFEGEAQRLAAIGIKAAPIYQAGVLPEVAYQQFYQDVKEGFALHADDPVLNRHIAAATGVKTKRGWRVDELDPEEPIDGLQAVSMSHWRATRVDGSVYNDRGMRAVGPEDDDDEDD